MQTLESSSGFSLVEVMVASAILGCAVLSIAQLAATATASTASARGVSEATLLAWQKIDQLRSLAFVFDDAGAPVTDSAGLSPSPDGALTHDIAGYVDYVDAWGEAAGGGDTPPPGTKYRRRWAIAADGVGGDVLILRVRVLAPGYETELASAATLRARRRP